MPTPVSATFSRRSPELVALGGNRDPPALGRELDGVGQQVVEDLLHPGLVLAQRRQVAADASQSRSMFFFSASGRAMSHCAATTASMRNSLSRISILPLSILARSRMSLIISSSIRPDFWMFRT